MPLRTYGPGHFDLAGLLGRKERTGLTVAVVIPARDEEATVGGVVAAYRPLRDAGLVDELVVVDSLSGDATARAAAEAGATVVAVGEVHPELPPLPGKGEALWRGLLATTADLVAYCDADVLDADPAFVIGLVGPMLAEPEVQLVKGFYRRPIVAADGTVEEHGGRVTELTARPFLSLYRPELAQFVQPLAGEWAGRRAHLASLRYPVGYGVEIAVLLDTHAATGVAGMAQSDLGTRTHRHQSQQALGVMAAEVLGTAVRRLGIEPSADAMHQFDVDDHAPIDTGLRWVERPPARSLAS